MSDGSERVVELARARTAATDNVDVRRAWVPNEWPSETFDLVVISELGYFLSGDALDALTVKTRASLRAGGTVLACHWRRHSDDCEFNGDEVHRRLGKGLGMPHLSQLEELDLRIDVWCENPESVAEREGFA